MKHFTLFTVTLVFAIALISCQEKPKPKFNQNPGGGPVQKTEDELLLESASEAAFTVSLARYSIRRSPFDTICTPKDQIKSNDCISIKPVDNPDKTKAKNFLVRYDCPGRMRGNQQFRLIEENSEKSIRITSNALVTFVSGKQIMRTQDLTVNINKDSCVWNQRVRRDGVDYTALAGEFKGNDPHLKSVKVTSIEVGPAGRNETLEPEEEEEIIIEDDSNPVAELADEAAASPKPTARPATSRTLANLTFDNVTLSWTSDCPHPPTGNLDFKYKTGKDPKPGKINLVKENVVIANSAAKPFKWPGPSCSASANPGEVPVSIEIF